eukprot:TRINITY_DN4540_c0_g2_i1.p1 TRINITY_DN4540_c0_g2~~TRINITY_DN4540_c0_g2_i1.p1  ORF type:complete len:296 (-),score=57.28 TRINITY_DN4540_c0_g2_i1:302-1189(-)
MAKKKKDEVTGKEKLMNWCGIIGGLITLITVIPKVPWRTAREPHGFSYRFGFKRDLSLFSLTNHQGAGVSWMKMRADVCKKHKAFSTGSPLMAIAATVASSSTGSGGAVAGCGAWQECKDHVAARCAQYGTVAIVGLLCIILNLIGAGCLIALPALLNMEPPNGKGKKKKKKHDEGVQQTMMVACIGFGCSFFTYVLYMLTTATMLSTLKRTAQYPYAGASIGAYMSVLGWLFGAVAMGCAISRFRDGKKDDKEKEDGGSDEDEAAAAADTTPLMPGLGPPGMGGPMPLGAQPGQ